MIETTKQTATTTSSSLRYRVATLDVDGNVDFWLAPSGGMTSGQGAAKTFETAIEAKEFAEKIYSSSSYGSEWIVEQVFAAVSRIEFEVAK